MYWEGLKIIWVMLKQEVQRNMRRLKTVNVELFDGFHHLCNEHNEIYHLGAEIGNRSDFFLQLVIHQKKFCHSPATLSAKSCLVFAIWFLSIAMFTILESSMHLLAWSKALIFVLNCGFTWLTREYTLRHITFSFRCQQCLKSPINSFAPNMNQTVLLFCW